MGKPYADDLRLVVVRLIEEGHTRPDVAELCGISLTQVEQQTRIWAVVVTGAEARAAAVFRPAVCDSE